MSTLIVDRPGVALRCDGNALALYAGAERRSSVPIALLERVVIMGSDVHLDSGVLGRLGEAGVALAVIGRRGSRRLSLALGPWHNDAAVRLAQYAAAQDQEVLTKITRDTVRAKLRAQHRAVLSFLAARPDLRKPLSDGLSALERLADTIESMASADALRGAEGAAAAAYFKAFVRVFPPSLGFKERNRRPPRDPVNSVLSLGYSLLHVDAVRACHVSGLDPFVGFLHKPAFGRESLACDLIEPLRARFDVWAWQMFRARHLREEHFAVSASGCQLQKAGRERFYAQYEDNARVWRRWLRVGCAQIVRALRGRANERLSGDSDVLDIGDYT